jgi:hypothetical protein
MNQSNASRQPANSPQTKLRGSKLFAARMVWVVVTVLTVGLAIATVPIAYSEYHAVCAAGTECNALLQLSSQDALALRVLGLSVNFYATYMLVAEIVFMLGFWTIGALIFWRRSDDWLALLFSLMLVTFGASYTLEWAKEIGSVLGSLGTFVGFFGNVLFFASFFVFPDGRFVPRWGLLPIVVWTVDQASYSFLPGDSLLRPGTWTILVHFILVVGLFGTVLYGQVYRYLRISGPIERQQTKLVVFGLTAAIAVALAATLPLVAFPVLLEPGLPNVLYALAQAPIVNLALLLIPLSIGVAILRYRLWDIDIFINRTLVYGALTAMLGALYFGIVTVLEAIFRAITGQEEQPQLAIVISTLVIAALFSPLRHRIQNFIDRRFYRRKYDARKTLEAFSAKLSRETDLDAVSDDLVGVVRDTMQPAHVALWLRPDPAPSRAEASVSSKRRAR